MPWTEIIYFGSIYRKDKYNTTIGCVVTSRKYGWAWASKLLKLQRVCKIGCNIQALRKQIDKSNLNAKQSLYKKFYLLKTW